MASASADLASRRIDLGRVELDVIEVGRGAPLLFLHGFPERAVGWSEIMVHLAPHFRCIAPDQRGYGASTRFEDDVCYAIDELAADVKALLDRLDVERATLVGHDWGGVVASWFAAHRPERTEQLILINGPHPAALQDALIIDPAQCAASAYIDFLRLPDASAMLLEKGAEGLWDRLFHDVSIPVQTKEIYLAGWQRPGALNAMLAWYRAAPFVVPKREGAPRPPWLDTHSWRIVCPALAIWGMRDQALLPSLLPSMTPYFDDLALRRIEDAGHAVIHQQPGLVAKLIRDFLEP